MGVEFPSLKDVISAMGLPAPLGKINMPIHDLSKDPGFFGPHSVTWRVLREPFLILGGGRALLMQAAHPLVAEGAIQHSNYEKDPFGRLNRTGEWVATVTFGTTREASEACQRINEMHRHVRGKLSPDNATPGISPHTTYSARNPRLALWVHATLVDSLLVTYEFLVHRLSNADRDQFVREWNRVGRALGIPQHNLWNTVDELRSYIKGHIRTGSVQPGAGSHRVANVILSSPLGDPISKAMWPSLNFISIGLLPPEMRSQYGIKWTPAHQALHRSIGRAAKLQRSLTPSALSCAAIHTFAERRARGDFIQSSQLGFQ